MQLQMYWYYNRQYILTALLLTRCDKRLCQSDSPHFSFQFRLCLVGPKVEVCGGDLHLPVAVDAYECVSSHHLDERAELLELQRLRPYLLTMVDGHLDITHSRETYRCIVEPLSKDTTDKRIPL